MPRTTPASEATALRLLGRHPRAGALLTAGAAGGPVLRGAAGGADGAQLAAAARMRKTRRSDGRST